MLVDEERIRTYLCDATSGAGSGEQQSDGAGCPSWQADSAFDVIVDDASHDVGSQLAAAACRLACCLKEQLSSGIVMAFACSSSSLARVC
mmetsp:Transcript_48056/g.153735  ORF Transcript_48056/g.153735 Transcript_48056/m.153735 type:complete len:90 (-) Transcript_48056:558-827(-)